MSDRQPVSDRQPASDRQYPLLLLLSDLQAGPDALSNLVAACSLAQAGSVAVVLRDRELSYRQRLEAGLQLRAVTSRTEQRLFVSDRLDLATELGADGVHLPADGVLPSEARKAGGGWVSRAGHGFEMLATEDLCALDALVVSPVVKARKGRAPMGLSGLSEVCRALSARSRATRVYALGGVDAGAAEGCLMAGASGIAVMGAVSDPVALRELLSALRIERELD